MLAPPLLAMGPFGYLGDYAVLWALYLSLLVHTWCFFRFFPKKRRRHFALVTGNLLVFACMMGLAALVAESYLRFLSVRTDAFGLSLPARRWFALHTELNSLGCRDVEWIREKPRGVRRIAFVGDSFAYGWGIERVEHRFADRIQAMFGGRVPGTVQTMNIAKPGWDTGAQLQPIKDMIDVYGADEVVLCYVPNDIEEVIPITPGFNPLLPPDPTWFNLEASCLLDDLYRKFYLPRLPTVAGYHDWLAGGFDDPSILRLHTDQLDAIIHACRDRNVTLRVVLLPFIRTQGVKFSSERIHAIVRQHFEKSGIEVLDLLPTIANHEPADLMVNRQDAHPNEQAHKLFANAIWRTFYAEQ